MCKTPKDSHIHVNEAGEGSSPAKLFAVESDLLLKFFGSARALPDTTRKDQLYSLIGKMRKLRTAGE